MNVCISETYAYHLLKSYNEYAFRLIKTQYRFTGTVNPNEMPHLIN